VRIVGNLKFDEDSVPPVADAPILRELAGAGWLVNDPAHPVLLLASTHPGEETLLARRFLELRSQFPDLRLVVAPRHVERATVVEDELNALGLRVVRRSALGNGPRKADTLLLDTTGELRALLALATVVVIGKCWLPGSRGGQNPVEALAAGRPAVVGPSMDNFAEITSALLDARAIIQVPDAGPALHQALFRLLSDAPARAALVSNATAVLTQHHGAAARTAEIILAELSFPSGPTL
jgi:3-deoxy-D-manno-octulosonic-acid transferase